MAKWVSVHELQKAVAAALQGEVRAFAQFGQPRVSFHQIIAVAFRMRRSEADSVQAFNRLHGLEQLDKRRDRRSGSRDGWRVTRRLFGGRGRFHFGRRLPQVTLFATAIAGHNLSEQGYFPYPAGGQFAALGHDVREVRLRSSPRVAGTMQKVQC